MNHLTPFRQLARQLEDNPHLVLLNYQEFEGIAPEAPFIKEIEEAIGFNIPTSILDFYTASNGLRLSWVHKEDDFYDQYQHQPYALPKDFETIKKEAFNTEDVASYHESGSINIRSIADVFMEDIPMNEYLCEEGFYVFDSFSGIHGAAISFPKSKDAPIVSFNSDYYTHFDDYDGSMPFTAYLEFLIQSKGVKTLRKNQQHKALLEEDLSTWPEEFYFCEY